MSLDYILNVYYGEKFICSLGANYAGGYDNIIWRQLDELINDYKDKEISKELFETTIEDYSDYFYCLDKDFSNIETSKIDFLNQVISQPYFPINTFEEFPKNWEGDGKIVKEGNNYYEVYNFDCSEFDGSNCPYFDGSKCSLYDEYIHTNEAYEGHHFECYHFDGTQMNKKGKLIKHSLKNVEFDEELLLKDIVTFDEFHRIFKFYESLYLEDNLFILNDSKVIRLNLA